MTKLGRVLWIGMVTVLAAGTALAQPPDDSNIKFGSGFVRKQQAPVSPPVKTQPEAWPRLDPGSVMCRTEADLDRLAARRRGEAVTGSVDCLIVRAATPIDIVQRKGPGRTAFKSQAPGAMPNGWTDAWLPEKPPVSAAR